MTYHPEAHRRQIRERLVQLIQQGGAGWHAYAIDQAKRYEREDPSLHGGLEADVRRAAKAASQATNDRRP